MCRSSPISAMTRRELWIIIMIGPDDTLRLKLSILLLSLSQVIQGLLFFPTWAPEKRWPLYGLLTSYFVMWICVALLFAPYRSFKEFGRTRSLKISWVA